MVTFIGRPSLCSQFLLLLFVSKWRRTDRSRQAAASPLALPLPRQTSTKLSPLVHRFLHSLSKNLRPHLLLHLAAEPLVVVSSAGNWPEQVMKTQDLVFASRPQSSIADRLLYNSSGISFAPYSERGRQR
ncbi:hypothetical protein AXF42_Ash009353 [Apostasia shenzhenica]|uniref:Secreted protein n=1 Tax=Apostasia shenzhenica TaxID=1088818 RepID=A0A2I0B3U5_9ASPA|nr:hypothetical protein AXF42_Ash009353 [Apostasia shenzhenica]